MGGRWARAGWVAIGLWAFGRRGAAHFGKNRPARANLVYELLDEVGRLSRGLDLTGELRMDEDGPEFARNSHGGGAVAVGAVALDDRVAGGEVSGAGTDNAGEDGQLLLKADDGVGVGGLLGFLAQRGNVGLDARMCSKTGRGAVGGGPSGRMITSQEVGIGGGVAFSDLPGEKEPLGF